MEGRKFAIFLYSNFGKFILSNSAISSSFLVFSIFNNNEYIVKIYLISAFAEYILSSSIDVNGTCKSISLPSFILSYFLKFIQPIASITFTSIFANLESLTTHE